MIFIFNVQLKYVNICRFSQINLLDKQNANQPPGELTHNTTNTQNKTHSTQTLYFFHFFIKHIFKLDLKAFPKLLQFRRCVL